MPTTTLAYFDMSLFASPALINLPTVVEFCTEHLPHTFKHLLVQVFVLAMEDVLQDSIGFKLSLMMHSVEIVELHNVYVGPGPTQLALRLPSPLIF